MQQIGKRVVSAAILVLLAIVCQLPRTNSLMDVLRADAGALATRNISESLYKPRNLSLTPNLAAVKQN